jgi:uncharacterized protein (TIGR02231 family)
MGLLLLPRGMAEDRAGQEPPKIQAVTVYRDRAIVQRRGTYALKKGLNRLLFDRFSPNLQEVSLRARLQKGDGGKILNITSWVDQRREIQDEAVKALDARVEALDGELSTLSDARHRNSVNRRFLDAYRRHAHAEISHSTLEAKPALERWRKAVEGLSERDERLGTTGAEIGWKTKQLNGDRREHQERLTRLENPAPRSVRMVEVLVEMKKAGEVELFISYQMGDAGWQPIYELREGESGKVSLLYRAGITQRTGEEWDDVAISLSTAEPAIGAVRPALTPLQVFTVSASRGGSVKGSRARVSVVDTRSRERLAPARGGGATPPSIVSPEMVSSGIQVRSEATSFAFDLPRRMTVPRDGRLAKVDLATATFSEKTSLWSAPEVRAHVYRRLEGVNRLPIPLLAGTAQIFHRENYVGNAGLPFTPSGGRLIASTGMDPALPIRCGKDVNRRDSGSHGDRIYTHWIRVENRRADAVEAVIASAIPVSEVREAKVALSTDARFTPPTTHRKEKGQLEWRVALKPGEVKTIHYQYRMTGPTAILDVAAVPARQSARVPRF